MANILMATQKQLMEAVAGPVKPSILVSGYTLYFHNSHELLFINLLSSSRLHPVMSSLLNSVQVVNQEDFFQARLLKDTVARIQEKAHLCQISISSFYRGLLGTLGKEEVSLVKTAWITKSSLTILDKLKHIASFLELR